MGNYAKTNTSISLAFTEAILEAYLTEFLEWRITFIQPGG